MKRRAFLASLFAAPLAVKAAAPSKDALQLIDETIRFLPGPRRNVHFVLNPRQVGKSLHCQMMLENASPVRVVGTDGRLWIEAEGQPFKLWLARFEPPDEAAAASVPAGWFSEPQQQT